MTLKTRLPNASPAPRWLQKIQYTRNSIAYMDAAAQHNGDIFNAPVIGNQDVVLFISNPQALGRIFTSDTSNLLHHPTNLHSRLLGMTLFSRWQVLAIVGNVDC